MSRLLAMRDRRGAIPRLESLRDRWDRSVAAEFAAQPPSAPEPLLESDLVHLPPPVRRFVQRSGAIGKPKVHNVRVEFDAQMWRSPDQAPMLATSVQYNFFGRPARL